MEKFGKNVLVLVDWMNRLSYVRMLVCILPGIVVAKIVAQLQLAQPAGLFATLFLFAGIIVHFQWARLRDKVLASREEEYPDTAIDAVNDEMTVTEMKHELIALFGGNEAEANQAVMLELELDGSLTGAEALEIALRRKAAANRLAAVPRSAAVVTLRSESSLPPTTVTHPEKL